VIKSAKVTITAADLDMGTDTTTCTQNYSRNLDDDGIKDCDAGHILAHRLGGPGNQPINIFPQVHINTQLTLFTILKSIYYILKDLSINRGTYNQFEGSIYDCINTGGASSASLSWSFTYGTELNTKPNGVTYTAVFTGGTCGSKSQSFTN